MNDNFLAIDKNLLGKGLQPIDILILAQIQEFERSNGCYATNQQFADWFGVSTKTVERTLDRLEELKYIDRDTKTIGDNGQKSKQRKLKTKVTDKMTEGYEKQPSNCPEATVNLSKSNRQNDGIKDNIREKEKNNMTANAVPDRWIPKDNISNDIFDSKIHSDKRVIEILKQEHENYPHESADYLSNMPCFCDSNKEVIREYVESVLGIK